MRRSLRPPASVVTLAASDACASELAAAAAIKSTTGIQRLLSLSDALRSDDWYVPEPSGSHVAIYVSALMAVVGPRRNRYGACSRRPIVRTCGGERFFVRPLRS